MEDDIDIEEHDVLDNPVIKKLFPDISVIKKEITKYFDDDSVIENDDDLTDLTFHDIIDDDGFQPSVSTSDTNSPRKPIFLANPEVARLQYQDDNKKPQFVLSNKIILGSKPNNEINKENQNHDKIDSKSNQHLSGANPSQAITSEPVKHNAEKSFTGKLIVGASATRTVKEVKLKVREMKLQLQNINSYLEHNEWYCKQCCRLMLSKSSFVAHINSNHQNPIYKDRNCNNNLNKITNKWECQTCGLCYSSLGNLKRHESKIHKNNLNTSKNTSTCSSHSQSRDSTTIKMDQIDTRTLRSDQEVKLKPLKDSVKEKRNNEKPKNASAIKQFAHNKITKRKNRQLFLENSKQKCKLCRAYFSSSGNLSRHYKNIHKILHSKGSRNVRSLKTQSQKTRSTYTKKFSGDNHKKHALKSDKENHKALSANNLNEHDDDDVMDSVDQVSDETKQETEEKKKQALSKDQLEQAARKQRMHAKQNTSSKYVTRSTNSSSKDANFCIHCKKTFADQKSLIRHMYMLLEPKRNSTKGISSNNEKLHKFGTENKRDVKLFVCRHCSYYLPSIKAYFVHMIKNHKIEVFLEVNKEKFDAQCKYCPSRSNKISSHNKHLRAYHLNFMYIKVDNEIEYEKMKERKNKNEESAAVYEKTFSEYQDFALESVVFECIKCSICFLSSSVARDHMHHMELLINWKCSLCHQIFKENDRKLHLKQHSISTQIKVLKLNETSICNVLYNCTKCAIHFTEKRYQEHYQNCGPEPTNSSYCKICDMLIDKIEYTFHLTQHETYKNVTDFTIIDCNIIVDTATIKLSNNKRKDPIKESAPRKRRCEQFNCYTYCATCKCFLSDIGLKNKAHINKACSHIQKHACNQCGLVLTSKTLSSTHRPQHKSNNLRLQDFKFFDLQGNQIKPPIPDYPYCDVCEIRFLTKTAITSHMCDETDFLTCDLCNIKMTEPAYKLHMSFHFYVIQNGANASDQTLEVNIDPLAIKQNADVVKKTITEHVPKDDCKKCNLAVSSYDEVIEHCHSHYSTQTEKKQSEVLCKKCSLKFDSISYTEHLKTAHSGTVKLQVLKFDPCYFPCDNKIWMEHIFKGLPEAMTSKLVGGSIYIQEHRIKLEQIQKGSSELIVYKCCSCGNIIDPDCVYKHAKKQCKKVRIHPCGMCGLPFISIPSRYAHEKLHNRKGVFTLKSLNIFLFNQIKDKPYNNCILCINSQYTLYQCRSCDRVAPKTKLANHHCDRNALRKCVSCGLLFSQDEYLSHVAKHTDLGNFCSSNFKVILIGKKNHKDGANLPKLSPSFSGTVYDYTLYKCLKCDMCLKNVENSESHTCTVNIELDRLKCTKCDLYYSTKYFKLHMKQHSNDPDFLKENLNVITFNGDSLPTNCEIDTDSTNAANEFITQTAPNNSEDKDIDINQDDNDGKGKSHERMEVDKRSNIVRSSIVDEKRVNDSDKNMLEDDKSANKESDEDLPMLYKCNCGLHFTDKVKVDAHFKKCYPKTKQNKQNCSKCHLLFNPSELYSHILMHHKNKTQVHKFNIIDVDIVDKQE